MISRSQSWSMKARAVVESMVLSSHETTRATLERSWPHCKFELVRGHCVAPPDRQAILTACRKWIALSIPPPMARIPSNRTGDEDVTEPRLSETELAQYRAKGWIVPRWELPREL